jgi:hypothetical protein
LKKRTFLFSTTLLLMLLLPVRLVIILLNLQNWLKTHGLCILQDAK